MSRDNEYKYSEKPALNALDKLGYEVHDTREEDALDSVDTRSDYHQVILEDRLRSALRKINPWLDGNNLNRAVNKLRKVQAVDTMHANRKIHHRLLLHTSLPQDLGRGKKSQTVKFIDSENPQNNDFLAISQFPVTGPVETIKPDIVIFVNGIPLGVIECKSPTLAEPQSEALDQLTRYQNMRGGENEGAERLFRFNQFSVALWKENGLMGTYGIPREEYKEWKDPYPVTEKDIKRVLGKENLDKQDILLYALFKKDRLLDLLQHFTVFEERGQKLRKLVARYQQYRAVYKALQRISKRDERSTNGGVIWHTQGSGKSLTMLFLGLKLRRLKDTPTLLLVTDRQVLDQQIHSTFEQCGFPNPKRAKSIDDLKEKLKHAAGETITTLIQKFQERGDRDFPVLSKKEDIYVMVDEAHRTQYKELANNMRTGLPNAFYIGFTGTPIEKKKRNTKRTFGNYIDTYTIDQSIEDGATERIFYQGRLADIHLDGANLDQLFDRIFRDRTDKEKAEIRKRYARAQDLAEAPKRIETVCLDLIEHFENRISEPFKGLVVTTSRRAAVTYKNKLDKFNGPESAVIISGDHNDPEEIKRYTPTDEEKRKLKDRFKDPHDPLKLLVVCDMLLTGFDAPIAQVMYLDKPLKGHNLLQAIARVNRPYEEKTHGLIVDYYGVADDLQRALWKFSERDVKSAMVSLQEEMPSLESAHARAMSYFKDIDLDNLEECVQVLEDEEDRINFNRAFKKFSEEMDIVLPDPMANPYKEDLKKLGDIYTAAKNRYRDESMDLRGCGEKVRKMIQEHISSSGIEVLNLEPVSIMDKGKWEDHISDIDSDKAKASEMEHAVKHEINVRFDEDPVFYESLQKKVEELIEQYKARQIQAKQLIEGLDEVITRIRNREEEAQEKGLDSSAELAFFHALESNLEKEDLGTVTGAKMKQPSISYTAHDLTNLTRDIVSQIQEEIVIDWKNKVKVQKQMKKEIKLFLYRNYSKLGKGRIEKLVNQLIELAREHF